MVSEAPRLLLRWNCTTFMIKLLLFKTTSTVELASTLAISSPLSFGLKVV